jgi:hypothetical protein
MWRRRGGGYGVLDGQLWNGCFRNDRDRRRRFRNRVVRFEPELFDEMIEREQRVVEGWLLDRGIVRRSRRRRSAGLALDFPAAMPADRQQPVFECLLTVWTTLHCSSRTARPLRA